MYMFGPKRGLTPLVLNIQTIIQVGLLEIWLYLVRALTWLTSWMTLELHSYINLEVSYKILKFLLVFDR